MIGKNIKELRTQLGLSQQKLADKLGIPRPTIASWEQGISSPNSNMLARLKEVLNCSYEELIEGKL